MESVTSYKEGKVLLIDKPLQWTSFQVVNKLRWVLKKHFNLSNLKVGHAGTLDPLATGLLIICTGKFTKKIEEYQAQTKEYTGTITLGATTPSYDLETAIDAVFSIDHINHDMIYQTATTFVGEIEQVPPIFSALKKEGKRLYELAREGKTTEIVARKIIISEFEITNISFPNVDFRVVCSKGTYIRSLAYDFGKALQTGSHLSALRRTKIGEFKVEDAVQVADFILKYPVED